MILKQSKAKKSNRDGKPIVYKPWWRTDLCFAHDHESGYERFSCKESKKAWYAKMKQNGSAMEPVSTEDTCLSQ